MSHVDPAPTKKARTVKAQKYVTHVDGTRVRTVIKAQQSKITNGTVLLRGVDQRNPWVRRAKDLISAHVSDMAGEANMSASEMSILRRIGRRGGKSFILALVAVFLACFKNWRPYLGPGEIGLVMVIAQDRRQAREIMNYAAGLIESVPMLAGMVSRQNTETIELKCKLAIEIHTASFRSPRGYTCVAVLLDEIAYWRNDESSSDPDSEILNAVRPTMATVPGAVLLCASSPYARRGELFDAYRKHYGVDGDPVLVWQADTRSMNPAVPQSYIDAIWRLIVRRLLQNMGTRQEAARSPMRCRAPAWQRNGSSAIDPKLR